MLFAGRIYLFFRQSKGGTYIYFSCKKLFYDPELDRRKSRKAVQVDHTVI